MPAAALVSGIEPESSAWSGGASPPRGRNALRDRVKAEARLGGRALRLIARLRPETSGRLGELADAEQLSGRGTERLLRVARTVADLAASEAVEAEHLEEAARWRPPSIRAIAALAV